jgi:hypothetical protein
MAVKFAESHILYNHAIKPWLGYDKFKPSSIFYPSRYRITSETTAKIKLPN